MANKGYIFQGQNNEIVGGISLLTTVSGINLKTVAATNLYTIPSGTTAVITEIVLRITTSSGFAVGCTISVGKTASFNEWLVATAMTGLSAVGNFRMLSQSAAGLVYGTFAAAEVIALNVTVGATATTLTGTAEVFGYLV